MQALRTTGAKFALCVLAVGVLTPAHAAPITVNSTDDENNVDGDCSLAEAFAAANGDTAVDGCAAGSGADTITLPAGTYSVANEAPFSVDTPITLTGAGVTSILDGGGAYAYSYGSVFAVGPGATLTMSDARITNVAFYEMAHNNGGTLNISNTLIDSNDWDQGIVNDSGSVTLNNVTFNSTSGNLIDMDSYGYYGGGGGTVTISNSTFSSNAGGFDLDYGTIALSNNTFTGDASFFYIGNSASLTITDTKFLNGSQHSYAYNAFFDIEGGSLSMVDSEISGMSNINTLLGTAGGSVTLSRTLIASNTVQDGIFAGSSATTTLTNTTFSGNSQTSGYAFFYSAGGTTTLSSVTFYGNTLNSGSVLAGGGGGGVFNVKSSIVAGNTGTGVNDVAGTFISGGNNIIGSQSASAAGFDPGEINPSFTLPALADNGGFTRTHLPGVGSAAIDNGSCTDFAGATLSRDQRRYTRPATGCDVGAVEVEGVPLASSIPTLSEWGMLMLFLMLGGTMAYNMRRGRPLLS